MNPSKIKRIAQFVSVLFFSVSVLSASHSVVTDTLIEENKSAVVVETVSKEAFPRWDLSDLYLGFDDPKLTADWQQLKIDSASFESRYKGVFKGESWSAHDLLSAIQAFEALKVKMAQIDSYSELQYEIGLLESDVVLFREMTESQLAELENHFVFLDIELNQISDEMLSKAYSENQGLQHYKPYIDKVRTMNPYQKSEEIEKRINELSLNAKDLARQYNETTARKTYTIDGQLVDMSTVQGMLSSANLTARWKAMMSLSDSLESTKEQFAAILNAHVENKFEIDCLRGFDKPIDQSVLNNEVEREVIEALVASVTASYPRISHRYYAIKKKMLDLTVLHYCDRAAPLPGTDRTYTWAESKDIVLKAYNDFSPAIASIAEMALNKWTDALPREGKNSGAFCNPTIPSHHSYVLLNFTGTIRDVQAMAHEVGHAIHQTLAAGTGIFFFDATDVLAETASFFGEMLTFQSLLKSAKTLPEKQCMLSRKIELSLNNVIRQMSFHRFEVAVHEKGRLGAQRVKDLNKLWLDSQREALGPSVQVDSNVASFWAYVPHFIHSPFYVYSYAFSECLVNSLYAVYQKEPEGFQEKYLDMLRAGSTKRHKELLAPFGLDATDPHFWTQGLSVIEGLIDELEAVNAQIAAEGDAA